MGYIKRLDDKEKDNKKVVGARVSEDVLTALSMAEADSEGYGYSISITEIIKEALDETLDEITNETKIDYYKLAKWIKKIKNLYSNLSRNIDVGVDYAPLFDDYSILDKPNISGSERVNYSKDKVSSKMLSKMKAGNIGSTPSIDLYGHKIDRVSRSLSHFIHFHQSEKFLHIIHGKGLDSEKGLSILKSQVVYYLKKHPSVLAFCSCPQKMGGTGAVLVFMKSSDIQIQLDEFTNELRERIRDDMKLSPKVDFGEYLIDLEEHLIGVWNTMLKEDKSSLEISEGGLRPRPGSFAT